MNVNQDMLRPVLQNVTVLLLFVLPAITMRTYAEERRSGTIELLLTSPLTDFQIILGKFLGALALYAVMLAVTLVHIGVLFLYGSPEWKPILTSYLGLLLLGGSFLSVGLFISTLTTNQIVAYIVDVLDVPAAVGHQLDRQLLDRHVHRRHGVSVDHRALRRLHEGRHRHDARHLLPESDYVRSVSDRQVGRHRTVAGLMANRIFSFIGWLGTALVLGAVGIRYFLPARDQYATYLAWAGLVVHGALHRQPVARDPRLLPNAAGALRHARRLEHLHRARHPGRDQLHRQAREQALGPHREQAVQPVGPEPQLRLEARCAADRPRLRPGHQLSAAIAIA